MNNVYSPTLMTHWGDFIVSLWVTEYLKEYRPNFKITFDDTFYEVPDRGRPGSMLKWINVPWAHDFKSIDVKQASKAYDKVLSTHHRHCHKRSMYEGVNGNDLLFFDVHGFSFKCVNEEWYPTFHPTKFLEDEFQKLNLPERYFALHLNEPLNDIRFTRSVKDYLSLNNKEILKSSRGLKLVSTSCPVPNALDMSKLPGWLKIYVLIKSEEFWGSHSGFTSIASMYRKRQRSFLVNEPGPGIWNMGPPPLCYSNYDIYYDGSIDNLCFMIENGLVKDSHGDDYKKYSENAWKRWHSFETLNVEKFSYLKNDYTRYLIYDDVENCLVPSNAEFYKTAETKPWNFKRNPELFSISDVIFDPKLFERYH